MDKKNATLLCCDGEHTAQSLKQCKCSRDIDHITCGKVLEGSGKSPGSGALVVNVKGSQRYMQYIHLGICQVGRKRWPSQVQTMGRGEGATSCLTGVTFSQNQHCCYLRDRQGTLTILARRPGNLTPESPSAMPLVRCLQIAR